MDCPPRKKMAVVDRWPLVKVGLFSEIVASV